jgi:hypothetical protein
MQQPHMAIETLSKNNQKFLVTNKPFRQLATKDN